MSEPDGGFSFGSRAVSDSANGADAGDDIDAIEVSGEPVSRSEAKNLGIVNMDPLRESKSTTSVMNRDDLPSDITPGQAKKLEAAWEHLKQNEVEQALTLAQEVVFEYPSLVAAKLIIARCFINRKEFDKGLAILLAIPDAEKSAETLYYVGLCQSRLGRIKEAIEALKQCRSMASDNATRKRANDLLLHLQGEQTVCPICGKKTLYDNMVEVDNQNVCANCAKIMAAADGADVDLGDEEELGGTKKRRKLRPPLTKQDLLIRLVLLLMLPVLLGLVLYLMYILTPGYYSQIRSLLPNSWTWLPSSDYTPPTASPGTGPGLENQPVIIRTMVFDSPPLDRAVVGMELRHRLRIDGMENRDGVYEVDVYPRPDGPFSMEAKTGVFTWTPSAEDAGKTFEVSFSARFGNSRSMDQINSVTVSPGPSFRRIWTIPNYNPSKVVHILSEGLSGGDGNELLVATGEYWEGEITVLKREGDGYAPITTTKLPGRPSGIGVIKADGEPWVAVADYWNSRVRYYAYRDGTLSVMTVKIDLPGRPLLVGFNRDESTIAALCKVGDGVQISVYKQSGQRDEARMIGQWTIPNDQIWQRLFILGSENPGSLTNVVVLGKSFADSVLLLSERQENAKPEKHLPAGLLVDAALGRDGRKVHCLYEQGGKLLVTSLIPGENREGKELPMAEAGKPPALNGFAAAQLTNNKCDDLVFFGGVRAGISLGNPEGALGDAAHWPLPEPSLLMSPAAVIPGVNGEGEAVVYVGADGGLWIMTLPRE